MPSAQQGLVDRVGARSTERGEQGLAPISPAQGEVARWRGPRGEDRDKVCPEWQGCGGDPCREMERVRNPERDTHR